MLHVSNHWLMFDFFFFVTAAHGRAGCGKQTCRAAGVRQVPIYQGTVFSCFNVRSVGVTLMLHQGSTSCGIRAPVNPSHIPCMPNELAVHRCCCCIKVLRFVPNRRRPCAVIVAPVAFHVVLVAASRPCTSLSFVVR